MKKPTTDYTGKVFNSWTVISFSHRSPPPSNTAYWLCRCVCGGEYKISIYRLKNNEAKRCRECAINAMPAVINKKKREKQPKRVKSIKEKDNSYFEKFDLTPEERLRAEMRASFIEVPYGDLLDSIEASEDNPLYVAGYDITSEERALFNKAVKKLTMKQKNILDLYLRGLSQADIAEKLNLCQTSISKALYGNETMYKGKRVRHGGIIKKLKDLVEKMKNG